MTKFVLPMALASFCGLALAGESPAGLWRTYDGVTGTANAIVRLTDSNGSLTGRIERVLDSTQAGTLCAQCRDERANQPLLGLVIIRNVRKEPGDEAVWSGGDILELRSGKVFKVRLRMLDDGQHLEVRGYSGPLYKSQIWVRAGELS